MRANIESINSRFGLGCMGIGCAGLGDGDTLDESSFASANTSSIDTNPSDVSAFMNSSSDAFSTPDMYGIPINTTNGTTNSGTPSFSSFVSNLTNSFTSIFKAIQPLPAGCSQVNNIYGQSTQCNATGTSGALSLSGATGLSTSTLLLIGAGIVVIMIMKK